jgi:hypothetical protein
MAVFAAIAALGVGIGQASAQSIGGAVPPYEPKPLAAPPVRSDDVSVPSPAAEAPGTTQDIVQTFRSAYAHAGKPKLAIFWNRQLTDALHDWYGDARLVITNTSEGSLSGNVSSPSVSGAASLNGSSSQQTTVEMQRRLPDPNNQRLQPSESWEWQFQDGFLTPFLAAGATVLDRTAMMRITAAGTRGDSSMIEMKALQGMADLLIDILVTPQARATTGYELRARVLEVKTGRIVAYVNSRSLKGWNPPKQAIATSHGFEMPDEDDDAFGPESDTRYKATSDGFVATRKPPRLSLISQNLAYNVMNGLSEQWR